MYQLTENGIEKSIETWRVVVPLHDNDKKEFSKELIESVKTRILKEFGGLSEVNVVGQWQYGSEAFSDRNIQIIVDVPPKEHIRTSAFFLNLKDSLRKELKQHKIYVTFESQASELLSVNEFLQELGLEVTSEQRQSLTQQDIQTLIEQSDNVRKRLGYQTLSLARNTILKSIIWERAILGTRIVTSIQDNYPADAVVLSADKLGDYFTKDNFGKPLVVIGDYEYQSFILDKGKRRYIIGEPEKFSTYDLGDEEPKFFHEWHGALRTSQFIVTYVEELLVNYIILRELLTPKERIIMNVGSDGAMQSGGGLLLRCPAYIPRKEVQTAILDALIKAKDLYENGTIDQIALMQAKVLNKYNEKKAMAKFDGLGTVKYGGLSLDMYKHRPKKSLTIRQPWAWLICKGYKDIENRDWFTKFRGRIYVHAGQSRLAMTDDNVDYIVKRLFENQAAEFKSAYTNMTFGAIIGEVDITDCVTESYSPWFFGKYGFKLANPILYEKPIPCRGKLGLFNPEF
jgi:hypothetical protein